MSAWLLKSYITEAVLECFIRERERRRVRVLSARGLVLCFRPRIRAHVICYFRLKTTSFAFFTLFFHVFAQEKKSCYDGNNTEYGCQI